MINGSRSLLLDDFELPNLKFIKCDVEGHELSVFSGARRLIETFASLPAEATNLFSFSKGSAIAAQCFSTTNTFLTWPAAHESVFYFIGIVKKGADVPGWAR